MFIRKTKTRNKSDNETYFTYRLVASERIGKQVRQITLLNLGRQFDLPQSDWQALCARIDALLAGQVGMLAEPDIIETLAQRYAARLIAAQPGAARPGAARSDVGDQAPPTPSTAVQASLFPSPAAPSAVYAEVDIASLQERIRKRHGRSSGRRPITAPQPRGNLISPGSSGDRSRKGCNPPARL